MSTADYDKAHKLAQKEYNEQVAKGAYPYLPVLDYLLSHTEIETRTNLGLVDIPIGKLVGTSTFGRTQAFARNFMPLLGASSEFALKWSTLIDDLIRDGQRDPITALEFMNHFYVIEGNKRVSVSKYLGVVSVTGTVTRLVPKKTDDPQILIYYEFMDFYRDTNINYIWFSRKNGFNWLRKRIGKEPGQVWTEKERRLFRSAYLHFSKEYKDLGGERLPITEGDALLVYIDIFDYEDLPDAPSAEIRSNLNKIWDEFLIYDDRQPISLVLNPTEAPKKGLISKLIGPGVPPTLSVAFIHTMSPQTSSWTYVHELGRRHLEQVFDDRLTTSYIDNVNPDEPDAAFDAIEQAIAAGNDIIFTTSPELITTSLRAAVEHPEVRILNCSLNTPHRYIRTYYGRMYEAKFLTGIIAGAMAQNDRIGFIADFPMYGMSGDIEDFAHSTPPFYKLYMYSMIANINAFALGAQMVNPRARIYLEWSMVKDANIPAIFRDNSVNYLSSRELVTLIQVKRQYGLFGMEGDEIVNLAMPIWHWGMLYEKIIRSILSGAWDKENGAEAPQALNYWWGMSAGAIDLLTSPELPERTQLMVSHFKKAICSGEFEPFTGPIYDQQGTLRVNADEALTPEAIISMDWLVSNVTGQVPELKFNIF